LNRVGEQTSKLDNHFVQPNDPNQHQCDAEKADKTTTQPTHEEKFPAMDGDKPFAPQSRTGGNVGTVPATLSSFAGQCGIH